MPDPNESQSPSSSVPLCFGFTASVVLRTEWGASRLSDLAHLTRKRNQAVVDHQRASDTRESMHAWNCQQIERSRDAACMSLKVVDTVPLEAAFTSALTQLGNVFADEQTEANQLAAVDINSMLPACLVDGDAVAVPLLSVLADVTPVAVFVDVTIGTQSVAGPDNTTVDVPVKIRCTPEVLFVTDNGDVRADLLVGESIHRVLQDGSIDTFVVIDVVPVVLDVAVPVYGIDVDTCPSVCIGSDNVVSAIVRPSI